MSITLTCHDCERTIVLPERPQTGKVICPTCKTLLVVPDDGEVLETGKAYAAKQVKSCPQCRKETVPTAVICIHCGYNFQTGKQTQQTVRVSAEHRSWTFGAIPLYFVNVRLQKTRDGNVFVAVSRFLFGIPVGTTEIDPRQYGEIWTDYRQGFGAVGLTIMLLLTLFCLIPGLFWWIYALNKNTFIVRLPMHNNSYVTLYEGSNETKMRDILDTISETCQLKIVRK